MGIIVYQPHISQQNSVLVQERSFSKLALLSNKVSVFHKCPGKILYRNQAYCRIMLLIWFFLWQIRVFSCHIPLALKLEEQSFLYQLKAYHYSQHHSDQKTCFIRFHHCLIIILGNADTDQKKKTKLCYTQAKDSCNSPIRPSDRKSNFITLTRQLLKEEDIRIHRVKANNPFDLPYNFKVQVRIKDCVISHLKGKFGIKICRVY